ncbi:oxidoreductase [Streptomyces rishiriensis]|uniref:Short-subunit dehydrogenase n=1 Tax=Streptomyces rishiriensis TaxID=68264 RepID=A0ABU0NH50_STRRH|nr:oxidoreductase [Streptomyces rishiriensis]MDQ0578420.1 short-subunit dehydrogenase [Streptomyces rishiriensis]
MATTRPVALVTGASTGIGKAAALALVAAGFETVGTSRKTSAADRRDGVTFLALDVGSDDSVAAAVDQVIERFGRIDVLVNNAGIGSSGAAEENSLAQAQHLFNINVFGVMRMTKAVLPHMRARGSGRIINISSVLGFLPAPYMATYSASKHALEGYTESLDHEIRAYGVRALIVQPGGTKSSFEANTVAPDMPLQIYAEQRRIADQVALAVNEDGDDPAIVAKAIVAAATDSKPRVRYTAGRSARLLSAAHRILPAGVFDGQVRKSNKLPR